MSSLEVLDINGKKSGSLEVDESFLTGYVNQDLIHQAVVGYQTALRQGNASTKGRAEVSGGGKKPYKQKGTGRARVGSIRSPLYVGGGVVFGPIPRDFSCDLPTQIKRNALKEALKAKYQAGDLICINDIKDPLNKTKEFAQILKSLEITSKALAILDGSDASIMRVCRNIARLNLMRSDDVTAYDLFKVKKILITKTALEMIIKRVQK